MLQAHQAAISLHIQHRRGDALKQRRDGAFCKLRLDQGAAQGVPPRCVAKLVLQGRVGATQQQGIDQRQVAGAGGQHQGRGTAGGFVIHPKLLALAQDFLEVVRGIGLQNARAQCGHGAPTELPLLIVTSDVVEHAVGIGPGLAKDAAGCQTPGRLELRLRGQLLHPGMLPVPQGVVHQRLARLGGSLDRVQRARQQVAHQRLGPGHPRHRLDLQEAGPDRLRLLILALQLQFARLLRPLLARGGLRWQGAARATRFRQLEPQQGEQGMAGVRLDQHQALHCACHGDIQRVDVKLVQLQRLVAFVAGTAVIQPVNRQVCLRDTVADLGIGTALARHQRMQDHVRIFQPLGLVHREHQRRAKVHARAGFVFITQHDHGVLCRGPGAQVQRAHLRFTRGQQADRALHGGGALDQEIAFAVNRAKARLLDFEQVVGQLGDRAGVAKIGLQHRQVLALCGLARQAPPEHCTHRGPGEKVRMHDLVGIATQQELPGLLQAGQDQGELHVGEVLHLVDHDEVVHRLRQRAPFMRHQVQVKLPGQGEPLPVAQKQPMRRQPGRLAQQRLACAQGKVGGQVQRTLGIGADDAAKLLEQCVCVEFAQGAVQALAMAFEPCAEGAEADLAPGGHAQGFKQLAVTQKLGFLRRIFISMGLVQGACRLRQIGRMRDVKHLALGLAQLGQRDGGLAGPGRTHHHHRRGQPAHGFLCVVKQDRFVQQLKLSVPGLQPAQRHGTQCTRNAHGARVGSQRDGLQLDLGLIDRYAAQEARFVVGVVLNHLQRQAHGFIAKAGKLQQQAVAVVELGAPIGRGFEFFDVGAAKVVGLNGVAQLGKQRLHPAGVEVFVEEQAHGAKSYPAGALCMGPASGLVI